MAVSTIGLMFFDSVFATAVLLFGLGVGWNLSFVAATAQLVDLTAASERGRLMGFNDLLSALLGRVAGAARRLRAGLDRGRRAGDRRDGDRRRPGSVADRRAGPRPARFMSTLWRLPTLPLPRRIRCLSSSRASRAT